MNYGIKFYQRNYWFATQVEADNDIDALKKAMLDYKEWREESYEEDNLPEIEQITILNASKKFENN